MRSFLVTCALFGTAFAAACAPSPERAGAGASDPISAGTADTTHAAAVALLGPAGAGSWFVCSGSLVLVRNCQGYVLTAAHCCNGTAPTIVVVSSDYAIGEQSLAGGVPLPPSYPVVASSVWFDGSYDGYTHDFCMLRFSGADPAMPTFALPAATFGDGVAVGAPFDVVGFGATDTNLENTARHVGTATITAADATTLSATVGNGIPGPCEGDYGGPALLPSGASPAAQAVVGVLSSGSSATCGATGTVVASRVSSEIGAGRFITSYLADAPVGTQKTPGAGDGGGPVCPAAPASSRSAGGCAHGDAGLLGAALLAAWHVRRRRVGRASAS